MFCMVMYFVLGRSIGENANIGVISVCQDADVLLFESRWEEVGRPERFRLVRCPCVMRVAVQAMNKDNAVQD
jgi:hypothetical protein